jgi:large subunit ribosomal protein L6
VSAGFTKELDIQGVGYRAEVKGNLLNLSLGFSHPMEIPIPTGIKIKVDKQTHVVITGHDKTQVGQVAADLRKIRPPEPYKGKGVRYANEVVKRKAGKAAAGSAGGGK